MTEFLVVKNLTKKYGDNVVLDNVSFSVNKGEFFVVVGPSPSGKSVLLNCIMGLEEPTSGRIYINGNDVTDIPAQNRDASMVFQGLVLFSHMNVFDNIAFGLRMMKYPKDRRKREVEEVMDLVRLEGLGDRRITELSGGQQQRVALARSLILKPSILLFDEPIAQLDLKLRQQMMIEMKDLHRKLGITALYVTHDQEQAMTMADRIMVMNRGRIEQIGTPEEVYLDPATLFVAKFIGELNELNGEVSSLNDELLLVDTDVGKFTAKREGRGMEVKGKRVMYCIRPEKIFIGERAQSCNNKINARFIDQIYKGSTMRYIIQLKNEEKFKSIAEGHNIVNLKPFANRDITIGWNSKDAMIFEP